MNSDRLRAIAIDKIFLREDVVKRAVNADAVGNLVDSIKASGLHTPIRVRPISKYSSGVRYDAWELIAGRHRVEAAKKLEWVEIDANVVDIDDDRAELAMIDENLQRKDLEPAEFAYATHRRKEVYERLFPETMNGANQHTRVRNNCEPSAEPAERFTLSTAKASGKSERTIQMNAAIGKKLGEAALDLVGTSLNSTTELDALAKLGDAERQDLIVRAKRGEDVSAKAAPKASHKITPAITEATPVTTSDPAPEVAADAEFFPHRENDADDGSDPECDRSVHKTDPFDSDIGQFQPTKTTCLGQAESQTLAPPWEGEDEQFRLLCSAYSAANGSARMRFIEWAGLRR